MTEDRFQQDRPPIFLSDYRDEIGQPDAGKGWDVAAISSKVLRASILAVAMTAIGIAVLSVGNPVALVANVTDWLDNKSAVQVEAEPSTSAIQSASKNPRPPFRHHRQRAASVRPRPVKVRPKSKPKARPKPEARPARS